MDVVEPDETDDVVGELNIDNAERRTWLLKIPESLDEEWMAASRSGRADLGALTIQTNESSGQQKVKLELTKDGKLWKVWQVERQPECAPMCLLTQDQAGKLAIEGSVLNFLVKASLEDVAKHVKIKSEKESEKRGKVIADTKPQVTLPKPHRESAQRQKEIAAKSQNEKRLRSDKDSTEQMILQLFEREDFYSLTTLVQLTNQPQEHLKTVLFGLCVQHKQPPNKNMFELRPEFKTTRSSAESSGGSQLKRPRPA